MHSKAFGRSVIPGDVACESGIVSRQQINICQFWDIIHKNDI